MRRREVLSLIGVASACWPLAGRAQNNVPSVGYLSNRSAVAEAKLAEAFRQGLGEAGFVENRDVALEFRWSEGNYDRLPGLAADLIQRKVAVVVATDTNSALAANKEIGGRVPLVFLSGRDPVKDGLVASLNRPGGNTTGIAVFTTEFGPKRLQILRDLVPGRTAIGFLVPLDSATAELQVQQVREAARGMNQHIEMLQVRTEVDLDAAFKTMAHNKIDALLHGASTVFQVWRHRLVALAAHHNIAGMYEWPEFVVAGGLVSYSPHRGQLFRQAGAYAGQILGGTKAADLPVMQPVRFELVLNLKTAKALDITVPAAFLARADEVIE